MNKERILGLADMIEKLPHDPDASGFSGRISGFNMGYYSICDTPSCIAGWAVHKYYDGGIPKFNDRPSKYKHYITQASLLLDIPKDDGFELFIPSLPDEVVHNNLTSQMAAKVLRTYVQTGQVMWKEVYDELVDADNSGDNSDETKNRD